MTSGHFGCRWGFIRGNDVTVAFGAEAGQLELNVMEPVIIYKLFSFFGFRESDDITDIRCNSYRRNQEFIMKKWDLANTTWNMAFMTFHILEMS
jgi:aspartate ammonia-lyase